MAVDPVRAAKDLASSAIALGTFAGAWAVDEAGTQVIVGLAGSVALLLVTFFGGGNSRPVPPHQDLASRRQ